MTSMWVISGKAGPIGVYTTIEAVIAALQSGCGPKECARAIRTGILKPRYSTSITITSLTPDTVHLPVPSLPYDNAAENIDVFLEQLLHKGLVPCEQIPEGKCCHFGWDINTSVRSEMHVDIARAICDGCGHLLVLRHAKSTSFSEIKALYKAAPSCASAPIRRYIAWKDLPLPTFADLVDANLDAIRTALKTVCACGFHSITDVLEAMCKTRPKREDDFTIAQYAGTVSILKKLDPHNVVAVCPLPSIAGYPVDIRGWRKDMFPETDAIYEVDPIQIVLQILAAYKPCICPKTLPLPSETSQV